MKETLQWLNLQLFAGEGAGSAGGQGDGESATASGESTPAAEETRLRELGVPESVLAKRAKRSKGRSAAPAAAPKQAVQEDVAAPETETQAAAAEGDNAPAPEEAIYNAAPARMSWDEIMKDPEYNKQMQSVIKARLKQAGAAEENMSKLAPAIELLARRYGLDAGNLDADALAKAISDDDLYYEEKALEMGVPVETAKKIDQNERDTIRKQAEEARTIEEQKFHDHIAKLQQQGDALKQMFPTFDLATELKNPAFARMTSPNVGISVEDAYYAIHRKEIQSAAMQVTAQKTAQQMANAIRSGQSRPVENGTSNQAPSVTSFDYRHASKEQREALKKQIREAAAHGKKLYPGQH